MKTTQMDKMGKTAEFARGLHVDKILKAWKDKDNTFEQKKYYEELFAVNQKFKENDGEDAPKFWTRVRSAMYNYCDPRIADEWDSKLFGDDDK